MNDKNTMTTDNQIAAVCQQTDGGPDPKALHVAKTLRDVIDADCVILFGSRCRSDWRENSDIDLMIINPEIPEREGRKSIEKVAHSLASRHYPTSMDIDVVYMSREDYERKSTRTINNVARIARREGAIMPRNPGDFANSGGEEYNTEYDEEYKERQLRITDANMCYEDMHDMLDLGKETKNTAYNAQQALEHAMKALISAQGEQYRHVHDLVQLAEDISKNDRSGQDWTFNSDLENLSLYAGNTRYDPLPNPITNFNEMADAVTEDLTRLYQQISQLTGEDPWSVPVEGSNTAARPRYR